jgi:hypothetical protein
LTDLEDETVKIYVERILKGPPSDDVWSVDATAWIEEDGERLHQQKVRVNVLKNDGYFDEDGEGTPKLVKRLKDCYRRHLEEDEDFDRFSSQKLEDEKSKAEKMEGKTFEV